MCARRFVHFPGHSAVFLAFAFAALGALPTAVAAQSTAFSGPYLALDAGRQHVIGGSLVDGVDTLQDATRVVVSMSGGLRRAVGRVVLGGDLGVGRLDGALTRRDDTTGTTVGYDTSSQWHWRLIGGVTLGPRTLLYAYLSEVTRSFDVTITRNATTTPQQDEQGLLRYGVGLERHLRGPVHVNVAAGTSRADFGGRPTNITPGRRFEAAAGLVLQF